MVLFLYFEVHVENLLSVFYSAVTNDSLRKTIKQMAAWTITETDYLVHYIRAKGWMDKQPMVNEDIKDDDKSLSLAEAASLHAHLTSRYDTMNLTNIYTSIAHDHEIQTIHHMVLTLLNKQITLLEKQLKAYHVPFPKRPGKFTLSLQNVRFFEDDTIFRTNDSIIQVAGGKHAHAI